jgi:hypothetical protein
MAFGEVAKQIAQQAILSATEKPAPVQPAAFESSGAVILGQIAAMQKALKDDEELVVLAQSGAEKIRVHEIYLPSPQVAVLIGVDSNRAGTRVVSAVAALQLICRTAKVPAGAKPARIGLVTAKPKDSSG